MKIDVSTKQLHQTANYVVILFYFDHVTLTLHTIKMASVRDNDCYVYVFGNNLEAILEALEEEDDFESNLCDTANTASNSQLNYLIWEQKAGPHINKTQAHLPGCIEPNQNLASTYQISLKLIVLMDCLKIF